MIEQIYSRYFFPNFRDNYGKVVKLEELLMDWASTNSTN